MLHLSLDVPVNASAFRQAQEVWKDVHDLEVRMKGMVGFFRARLLHILKKKFNLVAFANQRPTRWSTSCDQNYPVNEAQS